MIDEVSFRHNDLPIVTNYELPLVLPENPMLVVDVGFSYGFARHVCLPLPTYLLSIDRHWCTNYSALHTVVPGLPLLSLLFLLNEHICGFLAPLTFFGLFSFFFLLSFSFYHILVTTTSITYICYHVVWYGSLHYRHYARAVCYFHDRADCIACLMEHVRARRTLVGD